MTIYCIRYMIYYIICRDIISRGGLQIFLSLQPAADRYDVFNDNLLQRFAFNYLLQGLALIITSTIRFGNLLQGFASAICFNDSLRQFTSARTSRRVRRKNSRNRTERRRTRSSLLFQPFYRCRATLPRRFSYLF